MKKKKVCIIILISFVVLAVIIVSLILFMPRKYYIPPHVLAIYDNTAEDGVKRYTASAMYFDFTDVYADEDGNLVFVLTREERERFIYISEDDWNYREYEFEKQNMELTHNESYTEIIVKCKKVDFNNEIVMSMIDGVIASASWYQGYLGVKPEDNKVSLQVIDIDTNEVIYEKSIGAQ